MFCIADASIYVATTPGYTVNSPDELYIDRQDYEMWLSFSYIICNFLKRLRTIIIIHPHSVCYIMRLKQLNRLNTLALAPASECLTQ